MDLAYIICLLNFEFIFIKNIKLNFLQYKTLKLKKGNLANNLNNYFIKSGSITYLRNTLRILYTYIFWYYEINLKFWQTFLFSIDNLCAPETGIVLGGKVGLFYWYKQFLTFHPYRCYFFCKFTFDVLSLWQSSSKTLSHFFKIHL